MIKSLHIVLCFYVLIQISAITGFTNFHRQDKNRAFKKYSYAYNDGIRLPIRDQRIKSEQLSRRLSEYNTAGQYGRYKNYNHPVSHHTSFQRNRKQLRSTPINFYQNYVNTVRQYFKQQKSTNEKPVVKNIPFRKNPNGHYNYKTRRQPFMPLGINTMMRRISSGWNDLANSVMNKWFSFYYTYYEDRKRSGRVTDPIDNEYDSSEIISVIPPKHHYVR